MLHITNGDSAENRLKQTGLPGEVICWRDVLHEGPAPAGLSVEEMRKVRAQFIAGCGWGAYQDVYRDFARRDQAVESLPDHGEVVLWFEHDLFDQLQLIQVLDRFHGCGPGPARLSLICIGEFPGIKPFHGLGQLNARQMASLFDTRHEVTPGELKLGRLAWKAFCSPDPRELQRLLGRDTSDLPFLKGALARRLEQFPSLRNGLSRTERQILEVVDSGTHRPLEVFRLAQEKEDGVFLGDVVFGLYVRNMRTSKVPLLELAADRTMLITGKGRDVLAGREDCVRLNGIDRRLGGVHLSDSRAIWRWDEETKSLGKAM